MKIEKLKSEKKDSEKLWKLKSKKIKIRNILALISNTKSSLKMFNDPTQRIEWSLKIQLKKRFQNSKVKKSMN